MECSARGSACCWIIPGIITDRPGISPIGRRGENLKDLLGDGAMIRVPPDISTKGIIHPLLSKFRDRGHAHDLVSSTAPRIQLRTAAHIGSV